MEVTVVCVVIIIFRLTDASPVSLRTQPRGSESSYAIPTCSVWRRHTPWEGMDREILSRMVHGRTGVLLWDFVLVLLRDAG